MVDNSPSGWRTADTNTNTSKCLTVDMGKDGFNPVMPAGTSFLSNTHCPNRNIHIIVNNN